MAKHHNPASGLLGMESDLHRVPRLLEGIGAIALGGLEASNGIDRAECEAIYEIVACAAESTKRTFKAWQGALERPKGSSEDVEDDPIFAAIDRHRAANAAWNEGRRAGFNRRKRGHRGSDNHRAEDDLGLARGDRISGALRFGMRAHG